MAPPHPYTYQTQYPPQQPPPYQFGPGYQAYQAYQHQAHVVALAQPRRRPSSWLALTARQFSLIIPAIIVILNIWWSIRQDVCPSSAGVGHECFWMLWLSLPIAVASCIWAIALNINARRISHHMSHIPAPVNAAVQLILAVGATVCFALILYHIESYDIWSRYAEGSMAALLAILMVINWFLFGWTAYEIKRDRRDRQNANSHIPI
ncbi:hypothetical protein ACJ41O_014715 [Fusarium nematophilum]